MRTLQIRIHTLSPAPDPSSEVERLRTLVQGAVARASAAPSAVVVRPGGTEIIELRPIAAARLSLPLFLAGLTRSERQGGGTSGPPLAVGLVGQFRLRRGPARAEAARAEAARAETADGVPVALAFLEWPDCRWWQWQALLDGERALLQETEVIRRAEDGDPLPSGLGRWWSLGRRSGVRVRYSARAPEPAPLESTLIH